MENESVFLALLAAGAGQCRTAVVENGGLMASLFLTGLVGSLTHCSGMCGPFVLSQVASRLERHSAASMREWHRLAGAALVPYQLGRATTYAALGGVGALAAGSLMSLGGLKWLGAGLLLLAAVVMLGQALPALKRYFGGSVGEAPWATALSRLAQPLFANPTGLRGYGLGLALGFLPCGLLYAALAAAAASGDALTGAFAMLSFAAGTVPMLVSVGLVGHMATQRWKGELLRYAPLLLLLNAGVLVVMAWQTVA